MRWLRATAKGAFKLDKSNYYGFYSRYDHLYETGLPAMSRVVGLLQRRCYDRARVVEELGGAAERVAYARRWLAGPGRDWAWIVAGVPENGPPDVPAGAVESAIDRLRTEGTWPSEDARALVTALFGIEGGGPGPRHLLETFPADQLATALRAYLTDGTRPLRTLVLNALEGDG